MAGHDSISSIAFTKPTFLVLSGFSGAGKTTVRSLIMERIPGARFSLSVTTRKRRENERDGVDYSFISREEFQNMVDRKELLETEVIHGNHYGTPLPPIREALQKPGLFIFDIDVLGGLTVKRHFPDALLVFLQPPNLEVLKLRLIGRKSESSAALRRRMERIPKERELAKRYDYVVTNDDLDRTVAEIIRIIRKYQET